MSLGFPAFYIGTQTFELDRHSIAPLIEDTLAKMGWGFTRTADDTYVGNIPASMFSWGEKITVTFDDGKADIKSAGIMPTQFIDWGKNRKNVDLFIAELSNAETARKHWGDSVPAKIHQVGVSVVESLISEDETS